MNNTSKLVTVIIPTKNREKTLIRALESVLNQDYSNLQVIIQDNNSKDGTENSIKKYLNDKRVEYHKSNVDLSMWDNWCEAAKFIKGDYFVRLDDDNKFFKNFVSEMIAIMEKNKIDIMASMAIYLNKFQKPFTYWKPDNQLIKLNFENLIQLEFTATSDSNFILYKTDLIKEIISSRSDPFYHTSLPDRYMNYRIAEVMEEKKIDFFFYKKILGIARLDHKPPTNFLKFDNYLNIHKLNYFKKFEDCQTHFVSHVISTINVFLKKSKNRKINFYINENIMSSEEFLLRAIQGHFQHCEEPKGINEIFNYNLMLLYYCCILSFKIFGIFIFNKRNENFSKRILQEHPGRIKYYFRKNISLIKEFFFGKKMQNKNESINYLDTNEAIFVNNDTTYNFDFKYENSETFIFLKNLNKN